jgi:hypothetical protein
LEEKKVKHWDFQALADMLKECHELRQELLLNLRTARLGLKSSPDFGHMMLDRLIETLEKN